MTTGPVLERLNAALEGRYRIERELGAGGMATVYLAEDERHHRKVALKVLKPELAAVVGGERFLAEIETTANLQHPHILPLYDSGEADSFLFYVMPYVEGESLRERLDRERQLPVDEAVRIARAVAGGLDYAHRQGVVHRDIKPANILLQDGEPVIADFGIALAIQQAGGGRLTETGLSLGTPYYMSPEQATAERDPDARSDVYSLACVLYEMLTGEPPFGGATAQAVLGRILTAEARPPSELRRTVPPHVDAALLRAIQKLPADRYGSAAEFARALSEQSGRAPAAAAAPSRGPPWRGYLASLPRSIPWAVAGVAVVALALVIGASSSPVAPGPGRTVRATLQLDSGSFIVGTRVAISRDGGLVTVTALLDGRRVILGRRLDELDFFVIGGTEGADQQFLSPDGRSLAFGAGGRMRRVSVAGGQPVTLDEQGDWAGGDWLDDGSMIYSRSYRSGLWRLLPDRREPERLSEPAAGELGHWWPDALPDGEHILFTAFRTPVSEARLSVLSLETLERSDVLEGAVHGRYVPTGHIVFARGEALYAVRFDLEDLEVVGEPVLVVDDVAMDHPSGLAGYDISGDGTLVYLPASESAVPVELVWVDRAGVETPTPLPHDRYSFPALSPGGRALAVSIAAPGQASDVWTMDLERGTRFRITSAGGADFAPVWTPSGDRLIYVSEQPVFDLYTRPADGSGPAEPLVTSPYDKTRVTFTPSGDTILYTRSGERRSELWRAPLNDPTATEPVYTPDFGVLEATLSPDGRWIAYSSDESGQVEVYIASYPDPSRVRRQVSVDGGSEPVWTRGGRELVFRWGGAVYAVIFDRDSGELQRPTQLFSGPYLPSASFGANYDVTPDGERFLMVKRPPERAPRRIILVTGFFDELRTVTRNSR